MNYDKTFKIELLNELSFGVTGRLITFLVNQNISSETENNFYSLLYQQFGEMLNLNLFEMSHDELEKIEQYWIAMDKLLSK